MSKGIKTFNGGVDELMPRYGGSDRFYRAGILNNLLISDGVKTLCDEYSSYWLIDVVSSHLQSVQSAGEHFAVVLLKHMPKKGGFSFYIQDDLPVNTVYAYQQIPFSDFPEKGVKLFLGRNENSYTLYLPSEH